MEYDFDTIVIGAGTGGLSAGASLKKAGSSYIIIEKKQEIGLPVRSTGAVSLEWVNRIGMPKEKKIISSEIFGMDFRTFNGNHIPLKFDKPVGLVYDFTKYEKYLADEFAGKLNIRMNERVLKVQGNEVTTDKEKITAKNLIMAAGPQSNLGPKLGKTQALVAYEETRELPKRDDFQMILWFSNLAPGGYFWDFAESDNTRKIGVCYYPIEPSQPKNVLEKFTEKFPEVQGKMLHNMAHQIPLTAPLEKVVDGNRLMVGDMVNAVLNTTAGGLQGAFWSGKAAGEAASLDDPNIYQRTWSESIYPWLKKHNDLHSKIHKKGEKSVSRYITLAKIMPKSVKKKIFGGL